MTSLDLTSSSGAQSMTMSKTSTPVRFSYLCRTKNPIRKLTNTPSADRF